MSSLYNQIVSKNSQRVPAGNLDPEKLAAMADELKQLAKEGSMSKKAEDQDEIAMQNEQEDEATQDVAEEEVLDEATLAENALPVKEDEEITADQIIEEAVAKAQEAVSAEAAPVEAVPAEAVPTEMPVEAMPAEVPVGGEELPAEGTPAYDELVAALATAIAEEKTANTRLLLDILEKSAMDEQEEMLNEKIASEAERIALGVLSEVLPKLGVSLGKYASLFVENEKLANEIGEQAEKIAAETGVVGLVAVEDIINQLNRG